MKKKKNSEWGKVSISMIIYDFKSWYHNLVGGGTLIFTFDFVNKFLKLNLSLLYLWELRK